MREAAAMKIKDPDATLDYGWDLTRWLDGDTVASAVWTVPAGLTKVDETVTDTQVAVWISGGTAGQTYTMTCRITTVAGRIDDRSYIIACQEK